MFGSLPPDVQEWRDSLEYGDKAAADILLVQAHVKEFIVTLFNHFTHDTLATIIHVPNANSLNQIQQIAAICQNGLRRGYFDSIGMGLREHSGNHEDIVKKVVAVLPYDMKSKIRTYLPKG